MGESIHLTDPDGNGVEIYYDRPRSVWPRRDGRIQLNAEPLDFSSLLATAEGDSIPAQAAPRTDIGHINLHVAELKEAEKFFHDFLGLEVMARIPRSATFLAAGGYHHHVAVNTWAGSTRAGPNAVGLISYRLAVPSRETPVILEKRARQFEHEARFVESVLRIRDPNGNWLEVELEPAPVEGGVGHGINP
jgi:catechol 2,3-dioxygenase